jgi:hypothetical protein
MNDREMEQTFDKKAPANTTVSYSELLNSGASLDADKLVINLLRLRIKLTNFLLERDQYYPNLFSPK